MPAYGLAAAAISAVFFIQRKDHLRGHLAISAVIRTTRATELGQIRNAGLASRFRFRERLVP
jgi:hypothetical protein